MRIARYQTKFTDIILETSEGYDDQDKPDLIRISEYVNVEFPPRNESEIASSKIKALDYALEELMTRVEEIRAQKQELLALTHEVEQ